MSGAGSGALSGAASGAAIGTQILPGWGTVIGSGVGAIAGFLGGKSADKKAEAAKRERKMYGEQNMAMNRELFEQEKRIMRPIKERLGAEAMSSQPLDYAQISARIRQNYANALRQLNETSGIGASRNQGARLKMAGELAGAYQQGLTNRRNLALAVSERDQTNQLAMNVSPGYQNLQRLKENEAGIQGQQAAANWGAAASGLGQLIYGVSQMNSQPQPPTNTPYLMPNPSSTASQMGINPYGQIPWAPTNLELPRYSMTSYGLTGGK